MKKTKSKELGLPIQYQDYPQFFDIPAEEENTKNKNSIIEQLLRKYKVKSIFDMTCGTGAQVFFLHDKGYQVVGSDFSPGLIQQAKDKVLRNGLNIEFIHGDVRSLKQGKFDAVITIDNAIGHLIKEDFELALENIHDNLNDDGIYIFDILSLDAMTDEVIYADSQRMTDTRVAKDGTVIHSKRTSSIDRTNGYISSEEIINFDLNGENKEIKNDSSLQIYTKEQLTSILSKNQFTVLEQYSMDTYTFNRDDNNGYGILTVAQKKQRLL